MTITAIEHVPAASGDLVATEILPPDRHPAAVYIAGLASPKSRRTMADCLAGIACIAVGRNPHGLGPTGKGQVIQTFPWHKLDYQHTAAIRAKLADRYTASGCNLRVASLRGVLKAGWRLGLIDAERYARASDLPAVRGCTVPAGRALEYREARALFVACSEDRGCTGRRDAGLLAVLYGCGLRRSEVVAIDLADYSPDDGRLVVNGKGNKQRIAYVTGGAAVAVAAWLAVRGLEPGPMFWATRKGGHLVNRRLSSQSVHDILCKLATRAGIDGFSPHDLRRTFCGDLLDSGADLATVQALMGHASPATTSRYDRRPEEIKRAAAMKRRVPYAA